MADWDLWVTRRALADIGMGELAGPTFDLQRYAERHPILKRFRDQRSLHPHGTELTQHVHGEVYNLHARNPLRGVTWHDQEHNVVFLLAVSVDHDYGVFERRSLAGELMPDEFDYADLAQARDPLSGVDDPDFFELAEPHAANLLAEALAKPGVPVEATLGHELPAVMQLEVLVIEQEDLHGDVYAAVRFEDRRNVVRLDDMAAVQLADILFPDADPAEVDIGHASFPAPRGRLAGDFVFRWRRPV